MAHPPNGLDPHGRLDATRRATLERLTRDDLIAKSMAIVRGKVISYASFRGPIIYTHCEVQVSEQLKGTSGSSLDVVVPGGTANNLRQINSGAPQLDLGRRVCAVSVDGASGLTQIKGLTQGLFRLSTGGSPSGVVTPNLCWRREPAVA